MPDALTEGETLSLLVRCIDASHRRREWLKLLSVAAAVSFAVGMLAGSLVSL